MFDAEMRLLHSSKTVNLCDLVEGKPVLVVNTASHCGFTPQFKALEAVHQQYGAQGLVVIGFASDDFRQEAKDEAEAAAICYKNYGVSFTMLAPSRVTGDRANAVFKAINRQSKQPDWNFNKYVIDKNGAVVQRFGSATKPDNKKVRDAIGMVL
ncbi:glutathione peroxidase [Exilibacterium tricleocarpae]|nr:glutathione peroxidase [Exilibacterium tricleocarpae]